MNVTLPRMLLNVAGNTVSMVLITGSDYEAQVLFEDMADRMKRGDRVTFGADSYNDQRAPVDKGPT